MAIHKIEVGNEFSTTKDGLITIIEDLGLDTFLVKFQNTGYQRKTRRSQIIRGAVKDRSIKHVRGTIVKVEVV